MKRESALKKFFCFVLLILFASICFQMPAFADYTDSVDHHIQCRDEFSKDKDKCNQILGKSYEKEFGSKAANNLLDLAISCHNQAYEDLDRCRDPKIVKKFIKNKAWRKKNKEALDDLAKTFEAADDKCTKTAEKSTKKCEGKKSEKKVKKCIASASKKAGKCLKKAEKKFLKGLKKLKPPKK